MRTMLLLLLLLVLVFASLAWAEPPPSSPDGYVIDESRCRSGGPKPYFFAAGKVLVEDCGDDCPLISEGTWKIEKGVISLTLEDLLGNAASAVYHQYRAEVRSAGTPTRTWTWTGPSEEDSCSRVRRHELHDSSARGLLKHGFKRYYPFLSERELTAAGTLAHAQRALRGVRLHLQERGAREALFEQAGLRIALRRRDGLPQSPQATDLEALQRAEKW